MKKSTLLFLLLASLPLNTDAFGTFFQSRSSISTTPSRLSTEHSSVAGPLLLAAKDDDENKPEYSQELYLREEVESPFRKVRFFFYVSLAGGALTSLFISLARIAAAATTGINTDTLQESIINAGIDTAGLAVLAFLYNQDVQAQESRLKRASKGADLARLLIRASKLLSDDTSRNTSSTFQTSLASLRRGRGIEKRVVICVAGKDRMDQIVKEATELSDSLVMNDLIVVPVVWPSCVAPTDTTATESLALPVGNNWRTVMEDEAEEATAQGVDIDGEGFGVIIKKNGKVGQRVRGIFLSRLVGDVTERRDLGMDVSNI